MNNQYNTNGETKEIKLPNTMDSLMVELIATNEIAEMEKGFEDRGIPVSQNNHLYPVGEDLVRFSKEYMKRLPSYED